MGKILRKYKKRKGATFTMMAFCLLVIFIIFLLTLETIKVFSIRYEVETNLSRLINNVVEDNIDFGYRQDGINLIKSTYQAERDFINNFSSSMHITPGSSGSYRLPLSGRVYGCKYAGSNGQFLYAVTISSFNWRQQRVHGGIPGGYYENPTMKVYGTLYIANSAPGLVDTFVFQLPIELSSTNFRTEGWM